MPGVNDKENPQRSQDGINCVVAFFAQQNGYVMRENELSDVVQIQQRVRALTVEHITLKEKIRQLTSQIRSLEETKQILLKKYIYLNPEPQNTSIAMPEHDNSEITAGRREIISIFARGVSDLNYTKIKCERLKIAYGQQQRVIKGLTQVLALLSGAHNPTTDEPIGNQTRGNHHLTSR